MIYTNPKKLSILENANPTNTEKEMFKRYGLYPKKNTADTEVYTVIANYDEFEDYPQSLEFVQACMLLNNFDLTFDKAVKRVFSADKGLSLELIRLIVKRCEELGW